MHALFWPEESWHKCCKWLRTLACQANRRGNRDYMLLTPGCKMLPAKPLSEGDDLAYDKKNQKKPKNPSEPTILLTLLNFESLHQLMTHNLASKLISLLVQQQEVQFIVCLAGVYFAELLQLLKASLTFTLVSCSVTLFFSFKLPPSTFSLSLHLWHDVHWGLCYGACLALVPLPISYSPFRALDIAILIPPCSKQYANRTANRAN